MPAASRVVGLRNQIEVLLEQAQIKLSSVVSDVLGLSGRRILHALLEGVHDPIQLAALAHRIRTSKEDLAMHSVAGSRPHNDWS